VQLADFAFLAQRDVYLPQFFWDGHVEPLKAQPPTKPPLSLSPEVLVGTGLEEKREWHVGRGLCCDMLSLPCDLLHHISSRIRQVL
jgi:hypothetical protein